MIFNVVGNAQQQAIVQNAVANTRFDSNLMLPGLKAKTGKSQIDVAFKPLGQSIGGLAYSDGKVEINTSLSDLFAAQVFVMEGYAHMTDFFYLNDAQRQAIYNLWHPNSPDNHQWFGGDYWNQVGEALMDLFVWGFTPWRTQNQFIHKPTEELAVKLPGIYNVTTPPNPPQPPQPPQPSGKIFTLTFRSPVRQGQRIAFASPVNIAAGSYDVIPAPHSVVVNVEVID